MIILFLFFITLIFVVVYDIGAKAKYRVSFFVFLNFCFVFFMGLRYRVGIDTLNYMDSFEILPVFPISLNDISESSYAPLSFFMFTFLKTIFPSFYLLQIAYAILLNITIFYFIYKHTKYIYTGVFVYLLIFFFYFNTEIMKESMAISCFLLSIDAYISKRWGKFYLFSIVACFFHLSALILLLFPFFRRLKMSFGFVLVIFLFAFLLKILSPYLEVLSFLDSSGRIDKYMNMEKLNLTWVFLSLLQYSFIPMFLLLYLKKSFSYQVKYESLICMHILLGVGVTAFQIIFSRFTNYTLPIVALLITETISLTYTNYKNGIVHSIVIASFITAIYGISYFIPASSYYLDSYRYHYWYPYHSIFNEQSDKRREALRYELFPR